MRVAGEPMKDESSWTGDLAALAFSDQDEASPGPVAQASSVPTSTRLGTLATQDLELSRPHGEQKRERSFERYDVFENNVPVKVWKRVGGQAGTGRVVNASATGMLIRADALLPARADIRVELHHGHKMVVVPARVIRCAKEEMAIYLSTDDTTQRFRWAFITAAQTPNHQLKVVITRADRRGAKDEDRGGEDDQLLHKMWKLVIQNLDVDQDHQDFIHECIRRKRLEFAFERYRLLRLERPNDDRVARCLQQIGTVLSFGSLGRQDNSNPFERRARRRVMVLILVPLAMLALARGLTDLMISSEQMVDDNPGPANIDLR